MELIVDTEPRSVAAKVINGYSRANIKLIELSKASVAYLNASLPLLSAEKALKYPLSIYTYLVGISKTSPFLYGETSIERAQTSSWVELANSIPSKDFIDYLEKKLLFRTFLVSNHITIADIAAYAVVKITIGGATFQEKNRYPCILRWAKHLTSLPNLRDILPAFEIPEKGNKLIE
jgi:Glutathione S-transferase, C-terminal domain